MDNKLKELFEKINLDEDYYHYFDNSNFKVIVNPKKSMWTFKITTNKILPVHIYSYLKESLCSLFSRIDKLKTCNVLIEPKEINCDLVKEYWIYTLEQLKSSSSTITIFSNNNIIVEDNKMKIEVDNKAEFNKILKFKSKIETLYKYYGFNLELELHINEEKREEIKNEINKSKDIKVESVKTENPEDNILYGGLIKGKSFNISDLEAEENDVVITGYIFGADYFESSKSDFKIVTLKVTDYNDSIYVKVFTRDSNEFSDLKSKLSAGAWVKIKGYTKNDIYSKDLVLNARDINKVPPLEKIKDEAEEKRVELHAHTFMSQMDSVVSAKDLIKRAKSWGHKAIAITDHNSLQAFPEAYYNRDGIKVIYGAELTVVDDSIDIVFREDNSKLEDNTYVVFDFETTGLNAGSGDSIIEVGAVKLYNGEIIDRFSKLIDPKTPLPSIITEITSITDEMLKGKPSEEEVIKEFIEWASDLPMVAHNAKFDASFLEMAYKKYNLGEYKNPLIDTLELSRLLDSSQSRHGLSYITKRYEVKFDEESHHRADYDAEATALVFNKMIKKLVNRNIDTMDKLEDLVNKEDLYKIGRGYHINLLAKDNTGLKNLFKLISFCNTRYFHKTPKILRSEIIKNREGLLIGSSCDEGEVFNLARSKTKEELMEIMNFYDYIEVQPITNYNHLVQMNDFNSEKDLENHITKIISIAKDVGKTVVATGDVHHLEEKDKVYREIIINQKVPGGGRHPLQRNNITKIPSMHFRTTDEMLEEFSFLDCDTKKEIVIDNPNKIADLIEEVKIIKDDLYTPKMDNSDKEVRDIVYAKAKADYGDPLPKIIDERIEQELKGIIGGGFDVIYLIAQKLVKKSNDDGYLVGSRGSVGSSLVATFLGISEVNPLPAHYLCKKCKKSIFELDGKILGENYSSGYDLPDKMCECGNKMSKEGQDMPFATFLGFNAEKVPDIDLNFSGEYQATAHNYTKELFGEEYVFRAGTIGTVAEKTAFGFVKGYIEEKEERIKRDRGLGIDEALSLRNAEIERLALGCVGVKRTTGQHPGGIIVVPNYMDIFDFSPYQYPADDLNSSWYTTHFDFHAIHDNVLKLDILGHDDPTVLKMLQDISGIDILSIPFDDKDVLSIFSSPDVYNVTKENILCETGTLGIPEFGTKFVIQMLEDTRPTTVGELLKISGLSHGTDVWLGNAHELIKNKICEFKEVIGCRDDIMVYLMYKGLEPSEAFQITEFVRKGKASKNIDKWEKYAERLREYNVPEWYIGSCYKIKYMFPKSHAAAYVMMALRVAWFKVHHPIYYYSAYYSVRCNDFDIETMIEGYDSIKRKLIELKEKGFEATNKESSIIDTLHIALEMCARGFKFGEIDLYKSDAKNFVIDEDNKTLIPPFRSIDGLGDTVAHKIVSERKKGKFISIEDLQKRSKLSTTLIDKMRLMGILKDLPESSQLSLF